MSSVELQILASFLAMGTAFYRLRPAIFVFGLGHVFALLGFRSVELNGQPDYYDFLPEWLYDEPNLSQGIAVLSVGTCLIVLASLCPSPAPVAIRDIPPLPLGGQVALVLYFLAYFFSTRTVLEVSYATADQGSSILGGGLYTLAWAVALLELRRRVEAGLSPARALGLVAIALFFLDALKGATGLAAGVFVTALVSVYLPGALQSADSNKSRRRIVALSGLGLLLGGVFVAFLRGMRSSIAQVGISRALLETWSVLSNSLDVTAISTWANGDQGAAHVLMCTCLHEHGFSRDWRSIIGALEYTYKPTILVRYLGLERTIEAPWELMQHFVHGGGVNIFGEMYWNGGWPCLLIMGPLIVGTLLYIDIGAQRSRWLLALSLAVTPNLVQGYGYGYAQTFRGLANGLVFMLPLVAYLEFAHARGMGEIISIRSPLHARPRPSR